MELISPLMPEFRRLSRHATGVTIMVLSDGSTFVVAEYRKALAHESDIQEIELKNETGEE